MSINQADNPAPGTVSAAETSGFRDPTTLTRWLKILLWTGIALAVISLGSGLLELKLLRDIQAGQTLAPGVADSNDLRQRVIGIIRFAEIVATIVVFAMWIYRANYNARQLGAADMEYTPGWSVGWFFCSDRKSL